MGNPEKKTKNNIAWTELFDKYSIIENVKRDGKYQILADEIKEFREPRLMAKFDHRRNLPYIFKENNLSILPISRSEYVIGDFELFKDVTYQKNIETHVVDEPTHLTTIDTSNIFSEGVALNCAYATGMINDLIGEESDLTINGRMSSKKFEFNVDRINGGNVRIDVENSQLEIDAGYESDSYFTIIEAKRETVKDFLIRQLYYPYRLWQNQTNKIVRPVFFTHSNDVFSFFIYEFTDFDNYSSLKLIKQKNYTFIDDEIEFDDIYEIYQSIKFVDEPKVSFPQANSMIRLLDLLENLQNGDLERDEITLLYDFNVRQTNYYTDAGRYLGLIKKYSKNREITYTLTEEARKLLSLHYKEKRLELVKKILEHKPFYNTLKAYFDIGGRPTQNEVAEILQESKIYNVKSWDTFHRRASTVLSWIDWILSLKDK